MLSELFSRLMAETLDTATLEIRQIWKEARTRGLIDKSSAELATKFAGSYR